MNRPSNEVPPLEELSETEPFEVALSGRDTMYIMREDHQAHFIIKGKGIDEHYATCRQEGVSSSIFLFREGYTGDAYPAIVSNQIDFWWARLQHLERLSKESEKS